MPKKQWSATTDKETPVSKKRPSLLTSHQPTNWMYGHTIKSIWLRILLKKTCKFNSYFYLLSSSRDPGGKKIEKASLFSLYFEDSLAFFIFFFSLKKETTARKWKKGDKYWDTWFGRFYFSQIVYSTYGQQGSEIINAPYVKQLHFLTFLFWNIFLSDSINQ